MDSDSNDDSRPTKKRRKRGSSNIGRKSRNTSRSWLYEGQKSFFRHLKEYTVFMHSIPCISIGKGHFFKYGWNKNKCSAFFIISPFSGNIRITKTAENTKR